MNNLEKVSVNRLKLDILQNWHAVLKDTTTGVLYHYIEGSHGSTITPVLDKDGKPVVEKPE